MPLAALYYRKTGKNIKFKVAPKSKENTTVPSESKENTTVPSESEENTTVPSESKENTTVPSKSKNRPVRDFSSSSSSSSSDEEGESMSLAEIARQRGLRFSRTAKRRKTSSKTTTTTTTTTKESNRASSVDENDTQANHLYAMLLEAKARCDADYRLAPTEITSTKTKSSTSSSKRANTSKQPSERSNMTKFVWSVANQTPSSVEEMSRIEGMGTERMKRYATAFMAVLRRHKMSEITSALNETVNDVDGNNASRNDDDDDNDDIVVTTTNVASSSVRVPSAIRDIYNNNTNNNTETQYDDIVITAPQRETSYDSSSSEEEENSTTPMTFPRRMPVLVWFPENDALPQLTLKSPLGSSTYLTFKHPNNNNNV